MATSVFHYQNSGSADCTIRSESLFKRHFRCREHEAAIRHYQGPDPLDPWFTYIQWVEQCFPKHGHEGHIDKLIKDCLQLFEKDERYFQDRRFVKLWIKYVSTFTVLQLCNKS